MQKFFIFILLLINTITLISMHLKPTIFNSKNNNNKNQINFSQIANYVNKTKIVSTIHTFYHYNPLTKNIKIENDSSYFVKTHDTKTINNLLTSNEKIKDIFSTNPDALNYLLNYIQHSPSHIRAYYEIIEENNTGSYVTQSFPLKFVWSEGQKCLIGGIFITFIAATACSYYLETTK